MKKVKRAAFLLLTVFVLTLCLCACGKSREGAEEVRQDADEETAPASNKEAVKADADEDFPEEDPEDDLEAVSLQDSLKAKPFQNEEQKEAVLQEAESAEVIETEYKADSIAQEEEQPEKAGQEELSVKECAYFTSYMQRNDRYGFLLSVYDTPKDINLQELFYSGAGFRNESFDSKKETDAYLKASGCDEIYTDVVKLKAEQIDSFLKETTGYGYAEMNKPLLQWTYLPEYDAYYHMAGDTNYMSYECISGVRDGDLYILDFQLPNAETALYAQYFSRLTLREKGNDYQIVSNQYFPADRVVRAQSFYDWKLEPRGKVDFLTIAPNTQADPHWDVSFQVWQDGMPVQFLSGPESGLIRKDLIFDKIQDINFTDYNKDGYTDLILLLDYTISGGKNDGEAYREVRIYKGSEYGSLVYDKKGSKDASELKEKTRTSVKEFLGIG